MSSAGAPIEGPTTATPPPPARRRAWRATRWLIVPLLAAATLGALMVPRANTAMPALQGDVLPGWTAPNFHLVDQFGRPVSLRQFRGRPVVLTFLHTSCTQTCPLVAEKLRRAVAELGRAGTGIELVAVSTDPEGDTPAAARQFSVKHRLLHRWHFLLGRRPALAAVWQAYHVYAPPVGTLTQIKRELLNSTGPSSSVLDTHTSATYLIDSRGRERALLTGDPDAVSLFTDLQILLGISPSGAAIRLIPAPQPGHPAPEFTLPALRGPPVDLRVLRGKVVLINFWATWCTACRSEMPALQALSRHLAARGFVLLGVDNAESRSDVEAYARSLHVRYRLVLDGGGAASQYDVYGLPTSVLVDRSGRVRWVKVGAVDVADLTARVLSLLRHPAGS